MQNPKNISIFLQRLGELWKMCPDLRFFQLVDLIRDSKSVNFPEIDPFFLENDELLAKINQIKQEIEPKPASNDQKFPLPQKIEIYRIHHHI